MTKRYGTSGVRVLSPDCITSESLVDCSLGAKLLFDRVVVMSDDQGRSVGEAWSLKGQCFPLDGVISVDEVGAWAAELDQAGLIHLYAPAGKATRLLQVVQWWRYQYGMRRAYESPLPAPESWTDASYGKRDKNGKLLPGEEKPDDIEALNSGWRTTGTQLAHNRCTAGTQDTALAGAFAGASAVAGSTDTSPTSSRWHPDAVRVSNALAESLMGWNPRERPKASSWTQDIHGLLQVDKQPADEVIKTIAWLYGGGYEPRDDFDWRRNIRSGKKLRKHYAAIGALMEAPPTVGYSAPSPRDSHPGGIVEIPNIDSC